MKEFLGKQILGNKIQLIKIGVNNLLYTVWEDNIHEGIRIKVLTSAIYYILVSLEAIEMSNILSEAQSEQDMTRWYYGKLQWSLFPLGSYFQQD